MIRDLFRLGGTLPRRRYLAAGLLLFALKYALDYCLTALVFGRAWTWFPYLDPLGEIRGLNSLTTADRQYALSMLAVALPFIWIGAAMTSRRIRSAGLPAWIVLFFFLPVVNLVTIGILCLVAEGLPGERPESKGGGKDTLYALFVAIAIAVLLVLVGTQVLEIMGSAYSSHYRSAWVSCRYWSMTRTG